MNTPKSLTEQDVMSLKTGDKLLCIKGSYYIKEGEIYTFDVCLESDLILTQEKTEGFYCWRFTRAETKTPRGNKKCNVH